MLYIYINTVANCTLDIYIYIYMYISWVLFALSLKLRRHLKTFNQLSIPNQFMGNPCTIAIFSVQLIIHFLFCIQHVFCIFLNHSFE